MHFDDRLATVLRHRAAGERAARTQFRQLIDLLGERPQAGDPSLKAAAYLRLIALGEMIPSKDRASIVGESGWRFRNPDLVRWFGEAAPSIAASALYRAHLTGAEWEALIPQLPIRARGFLRHRRDLPDEAVRVLDQLGVQDRALPLPVPLELDEVLLAAEDGEPVPVVVDESDGVVPPARVQLQPVENTRPVSDTEFGNDRAATPNVPESDGIRAIVQRIEAFNRQRNDRSARPAADSPLLPLTEPAEPHQRRPLAAFIFGTDSEGRIDWAEPDYAPMLIGIDLVGARDLRPVRILHLGHANFAAAFQNRQPVQDAPITLNGAPAIAGDWVVDATPRFTRSDGRFYGYAGRFRRAVSKNESARYAEADRMRELLHELRTPVNAIQGFAEVIQQQMFGPTPHEYRALAASIAGDAARMLAGFGELDRLARLETGALTLEPGESDFAAIARSQITQLQGVLNPRVARFDTSWDDKPANVAMARNDAEVLAWRVLATLAAATGAGETVTLSLEAAQGLIELRAEMPAALRDARDIFATETRTGGGVLSAGFFGAGFALRLARAEARAAGGELAHVDDALILSLPLYDATHDLPEVLGLTRRMPH